MWIVAAVSTVLWLLAWSRASESASRAKEALRELERVQFERDLEQRAARQKLEAMLCRSLKLAWHRSADNSTFAELEAAASVFEIALDYGREHPDRREWLVGWYAWNDILNRMDRGPGSAESSVEGWKRELTGAEQEWNVKLHKRWNA